MGEISTTAQLSKTAFKNLQTKENRFVQVEGSSLFTATHLPVLCCVDIHICSLYRVRARTQLLKQQFQFHHWGALLWLCLMGMATCRYRQD